MGNKSKQDGHLITYACACGKRHVKDHNANKAIQIGQNLWRTQCWLEYSVEQIMTQADMINIYSKLIEMIEKKNPEIVIKEYIDELEKIMKAEEDARKNPSPILEGGKVDEATTPNTPE